MWESWAICVRDNRNDFLHWLTDKALWNTIAGKSCPGRASTLINWYGITPDLIQYLGELPDSLKLGHYLPGKHIPIVDERRILDEQPDYLVLFAWHYGDVIMRRMREAGYRGKFVLPLPEFKVID